MSDPTECLESVRRICERFHIRTLLPQVSACAETLQSAGVVDVAVLGQFKAGKSSFLNAVLGRDLMPVDVLPATAVVTRIGFGPEDRALVRRLSGESEEVPLDRLAEYATEQGNPRNVKGVALVEVEAPSLERYKGIRFVDTPGLGSVFIHNTQASLDWLPRVGGALVAISANQPVGEQDLKLLGEVFKHTPEVIVLLTKADLITERQRDVVIEFSQWQIAQHTGRELPVLPFSTHPGYEALRGEVREFLLRRIAGRHEEVFARIVDHKLGALVAGLREYLLLAQKAALAAEAARSELRTVVRRERGDIASVKGEIRLLAQDTKNRTRTAAGERFHGHYPELTGRLQAGLRKKMASWRGNLARRTSEFQRWLGAALGRELARVSESGRAYLEDFLIEAQTSLQRTVRAFQDRLSKEIEEALEITFDGAQFHAEIEEPRRPDVRVRQAFDTHLELLWFAIPMGIFRSLFERHFLKLIPWEAEKNLSRLASQWAEAVGESIDSLAAQAAEFMANELSTVEGFVSGGIDRRTEIEDALRELESMGCTEAARLNPFPEGAPAPPPGPPQGRAGPHSS